MADATKTEKPTQCWCAECKAIRPHDCNYPKGYVCRECGNKKKVYHA
jgi:hypothetical protein